METQEKVEGESVEGEVGNITAVTNWLSTYVSYPISVALE